MFLLYDSSMVKEDNTVKYWIEISEYDIKVAGGMLKQGYYLYVGFMCHQSVEKMLKALYVQKYKDVPPYIHKLDRLLELTELENQLSEDQFDLIDELTPLNIQARYPAYKDAIHKLLDEERAGRILQNTETFLKWLKAKIQ